MPTHIYSTLRSRADWERATSGDHAVWSHDRLGAVKVGPEDFNARAGTNVWTPAGWDKEPATYPCYAVRIFEDPAPHSPESGQVSTPKITVKKRPGGRVRRAYIRRSYRLTPEMPEKLDFLCEAYRMEPGQVLDRLVDEAYRRDVVDSGLLAVLGDDLGIIAPR